MSTEVALQTRRHVQRGRRLTDRERQVVLLLASGLTYEDVARRLNLSRHTVKNHLTRIYDKLSRRTAVGALAECLKHGIIGLDELP